MSTVIIGKRHATTHALMTEGTVGDWAFDGDNHQYLYLETPVGLALCPIRERLMPDDEVRAPSWHMSGTDDAPTLTPSIRTWTGDKEWHGWLQDGKLVPA
jgi:hypothetical protein